MKPARIIPILLLIAIGAGFFASRKFFQTPFRYAGTLEATRIEIPARVATVVSEIVVQEGDRIEKGKPLVRLACEDLRIAGKLATQNFERAEGLRKGGAMSQEAFDKISTIKQDSDARLTWCDVASPISGTVLTRYLEPGEWTSPGMKLLSIANLKDIWTYIYVPQAVMSRLKTGILVKGVLPELENKEFKGEIRKINSEAEFTPKNVQTQAERTRLVFGIKIAFENPDELLKPGMTIEISLE